MNEIKLINNWGDVHSVWQLELEWALSGTEYAVESASGAVVNEMVLNVDVRRPVAMVGFFNQLIFNQRGITVPKTQLQSITF